MQILSLIFQFIIAIPKLFSIVTEIIKMIIEMKARDKFEKEKEETEKVIKQIEEAKTREEKEKALIEAALKWRRK